MSQKLFDDYPKLFAKRNLISEDQRRYPISWGLEHGDGWLTIVEELCELIQRHVDQKQKNNPSYPQIEVLQSKEKFGSLRFYVTHSDEYVNGLISMAESISGRTCESCGNPGTIRGKGWIRVRCEPCEEIRAQKMQEIENAETWNSSIGSQE
jgi:hypothetical protein